MKLFIPALLALLASACSTTRTGRGGGDDDGGGGDGPAGAWVLEDLQVDDEIGVAHDLRWANRPGLCDAIRRENQVFDALNDQYDRGYDGVLDEFGDEDAPGAAEALCELERTYYGGVADAGLPLLEDGVERVTISFWGLEDPFSEDLPPAGYTTGGDSYWTGSWAGGGSPGDWVRAWDDVDCRDGGEVEGHWDAIEAEWPVYDLDQGTIWVSAPSNTTRATTTEDVLRVDDEGEVERFDLEEEFARCDLR